MQPIRISQVTNKSVTNGFIYLLIFPRIIEDVAMFVWFVDFNIAFDESIDFESNLPICSSMKKKMMMIISGIIDEEIEKKKEKKKNLIN